MRALSESNAGAWKDKQAPKGIYQLKGGIQKYLETYGAPCENGNDTILNSPISECKLGKDELACLYRGKNFVFDPRRTDPIVGNGITETNQVGQSTNDIRVSLVGKCVICSTPHDDYDNGHSPCEGKESRCCRCRVLVLVCNDCRTKVKCWGEPDGKDELYCGDYGKRCVDDGNIAEYVKTAIF